MRNWNDLLPPAVAREQVAYETDRMAWRMRSLGFSFPEIGKKLGASSTRARDRFKKFERNKDRLSPAERYLAGIDLGLKEFADKLINQDHRKVARAESAYLKQCSWAGG